MKTNLEQNLFMQPQFLSKALVCFLKLSEETKEIFSEAHAVMLHQKFLLPIPVNRLGQNLAKKLKIYVSPALTVYSLLFSLNHYADRSVHTTWLDEIKGSN